MKTKMTAPTIASLRKLFIALKPDMHDDYRVEGCEDDTTPSMQVTVSTNEAGDSWAYQTGDNSYTGSCYGQPHWAVVTLTRRSNSLELAREAHAELLEAFESGDGQEV